MSLSAKILLDSHDLTEYITYLCLCVYQGLHMRRPQKGGLHLSPSTLVLRHCLLQNQNLLVQLAWLVSDNSGPNYLCFPKAEVTITCNFAQGAKDLNSGPLASTGSTLNHRAIH